MRRDEEDEEECRCQSWVGEECQNWVGFVSVVEDGVGFSQAQYTPEKGRCTICRTLVLYLAEALMIIHALTDVRRDA